MLTHKTIYAGKQFCLATEDLTVGILDALKNHLSGNIVKHFN